MTTNQKAVANLKSKGLVAKEEHNSVYIDIDGMQLELSSQEIVFQAKSYESKHAIVEKLRDLADGTESRTVTTPSGVKIWVF